jgi:hypothetical protein
MRYTLDNLKSVERSIQVFNKENNELTKEFDIDIPLEDLSKIIKPKKDDPYLHKFYILDKAQTEKLLPYVKALDHVNLEINYCVLACFGIYG